MSKYIIRNWAKWQTYRRDRGKPPWIKVHRSLMEDLDWIELTDTQRGQLIAMWMFAAKRDGVIVASPAQIKKVCHMSSVPDMQFFVDKGFIAIDVSMTSTRRQHDAPETETETETEKRQSNICEFRENFEKARQLYPGKKRGLDVEFENFKKHHKDWRDLLDDDGLARCVQVLIDRKAYSDGFWPMFQTFCNQSRYEEALT